MERTEHDGDCTIYASLDNGFPEAGICTCGYGHSYGREHEGDFSRMYSRELSEKLEAENSGSISSEELMKMMRNGGWRVSR